MKNQDSLIEAKTKYHQIIKTLFTSSLINPRINLPETNTQLFTACNSGDARFVNEFSKKKIDFEGILYTLNEDDRTAVIFRCLEARGGIIIPRAIEKDDNRFILFKSTR